jgi:DNA-binding CsgD family transcriptional regulator
MSNPWGVTAREAQVLDMICEKGSGKIASMELGISAQTVCAMLMRVKRRMGARTRTLVLLEWDRWSRAQEGAS